MAREKKKSDWDAMQDLLSASDANDWSVDVASNDETATPAVETAVETADEKTEKNAEPAPKKTSCRTKKAASGAKKTAKSRKKTATKSKSGDAVAAALSTETTPVDVETIDVAVGGEAPKKRRRTAPKKNAESETDLVKSVLKLEQEEKENAKKRARSKATELPFAGLLSQIGQIAETAVADVEVDDKEEKTASEPDVEIEFAFNFDATTQDASDADAFSFDFFGGETETLDISWGKPVRDDASVEAVDAESQPESAPVAVDENEARPSRRDRDSRRRRRDDAPKAQADDAPVSLDLNDLEAFFGTPQEDEGVGFAPRRAASNADDAPAPKTKKEEKNLDASPEKTVAFVEPQDADDEENVECSRREGRNRRRRRGDRREFAEDDAPRSFSEAPADAETPFAMETETAERNPERRRENRECGDDSRNRNRRERRPRRERNDETNVPERETAPVADENRDETRRVLPSWNDAISYVVRFNLSRRTNRRKN